MERTDRPGTITWADRRPVGPHLRYADRRSPRPLAGLPAVSYAARSLPCRDDFIGWDEAARRKRLERVVGNPRFLILPWVRVGNLASTGPVAGDAPPGGRLEGAPRLPPRCWWRPSSTRPGSTAPATGRRTGGTWARPRASGRRAPRKAFSCSRWTRTSGRSWSKGAGARRAGAAGGVGWTPGRTVGAADRRGGGGGSRLRPALATAPGVR